MTIRRSTSRPANTARTDQNAEITPPADFWAALLNRFRPAVPEPELLPPDLAPVLPDRPDLNAAREMQGQHPATLSVRALKAVMNRPDGPAVLRDQGRQLEDTQRLLGNWLRLALPPEMQEVQALHLKLNEARSWRQGAVTHASINTGGAPMDTGVALSPARPNAPIRTLPAPVLQASVQKNSGLNTDAVQAGPQRQNDTSLPADPTGPGAGITLTPDTDAVPPDVPPADAPRSREMLVLNRKLFLTQQDLMDTQRDLAQARLALKAAVQTQEQAAPKLHSERQVQHDQQAQLQSSLLEALRERDAARTQQRLLEAQLNALTPDLNDDDLRRGLGTPAGRERYVLLGHARRRLLTRFGIDLSYAEMSDLDEQVRSSAPITRTWKMTPVKSAVVAGQTVYLIVTPDTEGHGTITTVYTRDLLEAQGALPTLNPALNQTSPGRDS